VTIGRRDYDLLRPRSVDELISEEDFAIDERIPYWADCWPSSRVLGERFAREAGGGRALLELGCGIGLVSIVAQVAGYRALATDYFADALAFTAANAERNGATGLDTRLVDWRRLPDDLGTFDVVTGADVLYEQPHAALIAAILERALAPAGIGLLCDPDRRTAPVIIEECASRGLQARCVERVPTSDAGAMLTVSLFEIRRG
jgi:predicted nicotinamide N-methyase